ARRDVSRRTSAPCSRDASRATALSRSRSKLFPPASRPAWYDRLGSSSQFARRDRESRGRAGTGRLRSLLHRTLVSMDGSEDHRSDLPYRFEPEELLLNPDCSTPESRRVSMNIVIIGLNFAPELTGV